MRGRTVPASTPPRDRSDRRGAPAAGRCPHCVDSCLLIRLGFAARDRDELAALAGRPETRGEVERAIARRALADRLSSVAALAAGVAHELNNPLAYVTANLAFLAERIARLAELARRRAAHGGGRGPRHPARRGDARGARPAPSGCA